MAVGGHGHLGHAVIRCYLCESSTSTVIAKATTCPLILHHPHSILDCVYMLVLVMPLPHLLLPCLSLCLLGDVRQIVQRLL
jgi:hypothetical protein